MLKKIESSSSEKNESKGKEEEPILYMPQPERRFDVKGFEEAFLKLEIEANSRKKNEHVSDSDISNASRSCVSSAGLLSQEKRLNPNAPSFDPTLIQMPFSNPIVPQYLSSQPNSGSKAISNHKNGSTLRVFQNLKK